MSLQCFRSSSGVKTLIAEVILNARKRLGERLTGKVRRSVCVSEGGAETMQVWESDEEREVGGKRMKTRISDGGRVSGEGRYKSVEKR